MSTSEDILDTCVINALSINVSIKVCEAYVEMWARIINSVYSAIQNSHNENDFQRIFKFTIHAESIFSTIQTYRVLAFMNLTYSQVIESESFYEYKENTNTFAYYVLCGAFMCNPYTFIEWCLINNAQILQFNNSPDGAQTFKTYMLSALHNIECINRMKECSKLSLRSFGLRMTLVDI